MKGTWLGSLPWDFIVFITVISLGLGFSIQTIYSNDRTDLKSASNSTDRNLADAESSKAPAADTIDLGCLESRAPQVIPSEVVHVRLKGKLCRTRIGRAKRPEISVTNATSGEVVTLFYSATGFVTDVVELRRGSNRIELVWNDKPGEKARTYATEIYQK